MITARQTFIALVAPALGLLWAVAALAAEPAQGPPADIRQTMLRTWREGISAPQDKQPTDLSQAVRQIESLALPGPRSSALNKRLRSAAGGAGVATVPASTNAEANAAEAQAGPTTQPTTQPDARQGISPADLAQLKSMEMEKLLDAAGAADDLYQAGQYEAAQAIYQRLGDHPQAGGETRKVASRDWLVFQLANCSARLGHYDEAAKLYQQLIAGFPESPWVAVAKVQSVLAGWQQAEKPADVLKQAAEAPRQTRGPVAAKG